ncbi:Nrap protein [Basidiobolus meristosporus CBS 931.73]|uniref:U3 small nucleolar RNA-associated protein 22 n=1 Tax=Basidiobolus meristosporus CBS 931.73 TaxID=1314790 RepID=A0A1Y1XCB1_9FUNG|nr:Nrap protein [Basidiobolus meristosporus CBS 931.73]|eukprot:ORX83004.1 Nrap protein [Basidiobolus meristosporus CBS 931.73]
MISDDDEDLMAAAAAKSERKAGPLTQDALYKAPTNEEMQELKDATELFHSNLFKLQIAELLSEVRIDYTKMKPLEKTLHHLRSIFDSIPDRKEATKIVKAMKKSKITIPFPNPQPPSDIQYTFGFKKPTLVNLIGSYPLKTVTKGRHHFNIDVSIEMPEELFQEKDHMNYRYFYKRAYYIAVIASALKDTKSGLNLDISFEFLNNDMRRPILVLKPVHDRSEFDFSKAKCVIRIIPTIKQGLFPVQRLAPGRNNVRPNFLGLDSISEEDSKLATPQYNASILLDSAPTTHLNFLYQQAKSCDNFRDACLLGKVWLNQRGFCDGTTSFNGFLWSMIMGYLLKPGPSGTRRLAPGFSSYQLFKGTIDFLANHDFAKVPIYIGQPAGDEFTLEAFQSHYPFVFLDGSGHVNLAGLVSADELNTLQHEAKHTFRQLNDISQDHFDDLFLKRVDELHFRYDYVIRVSDLPISSVYSDVAKLDNPCAYKFIASQLPLILNKGLNDRVRLVAKQFDTCKSWPLDSSVPVMSESTPLFVGIIANQENANRLVDKGPGAEDTEAAEEFRKLWGDKAELRRFKDGSIVESVVWSCSSVEEKGMIIVEAITHLLGHHFNIPSDNIQCLKGALEQNIQLYKLPASLLDEGLSKVGFQPVMGAFNEFYKQLREIELPLSLSGIYPAAPELRYSSVFTPLPLNMAIHSRLPDAAKYVTPIDVVLQLETSGRWPDDLVAIQKIKSAFYLKISEGLESEYPDMYTTVVDEGDDSSIQSCSYLDVTVPAGFTFRCRIQNDREITLLENGIAGKALSPPERISYQNALAEYRRLFINRPWHTAQIQSICQRFPTLSHTIRITKRWFSAHMLAPHFSEELIELICAYVYLYPGAWSEPGSGFVGFNRVLKLVTSHDWKNEPLIVDLDNSIKNSEKEEILQKFNELRKNDEHCKHSSMVVATSKDLDGSCWSKESPQGVILVRAKMLAKATLSCMMDAVNQGSVSSLKKIFATPLQDYDFLIKLDAEKCTRYFQRFKPDVKLIKSKGEKYRNLVLEQNTSDAANTRIGFDPVQLYLAEIKELYSDMIVFFHDTFGGHMIAGVWKPSQLKAKPWKVNAGFSSIPKIEENKNKKTPLILPNIPDILSEVERLGAGLVTEIVIQNEH